MGDDMKPILSGYDRNWMVGPRGEQPVLCRLVWVPHVGKGGSRHEVLRSWAIRNRLFIMVTPGCGAYGENYGLGAMRQVHYHYGIGFYVQAEGNPRGRKQVINQSQIMNAGYFFSNGAY